MHTESRNGASIDRVYLHTNEGPQGPDAAHNLAGYLSRVDAGYHVIVDDQHTVRCADDSLVVWAEGSDNMHCLSVCLIGYSGSTDWTSEYSKAMIERAAVQVAIWCRTYSIPVRHVAAGAPGLAPTERGIAEHADDHAPSSEGHTDPGSRFPIDAFVQHVHDLVAPPIDWHAIELLVEWQKRCAETPLRLSNHGTDVHTLNQLLAKHGYKVPHQTYLYGVETAQAVHAFKVKVGNPNHDGKLCGGECAMDLITK